MSIVRHSEWDSLYEIKHPLIQGKLSLMRSQETNHKMFRELVHEVTLLLGYEATQYLEVEYHEINTPMQTCKAPFVKEPDPVIVPILRAGIGMVDALLSLMPFANVGHIGLFRNEETLEPHNYFFKMPEDSKKSSAYICDPMLATGGSAIEAANSIKKLGLANITFICLVAAPEGVKAFSDAHPDIKIFTASLDEKLDSNGYILPGLGDAGDRMFGTN